MTRRMTAGWSLVAIATLAGVGWRVEVEWHGWASLTWIRVFHWAIPLGALAFAGWLHRFSGARYPMRLALVSFGLAAAAFLIEINALGVLYSRFPGERSRVVTAIAVSLAVFWLYPISLWLIARWLGADVRLRRCLAALALYSAAFPLAIGVLDVIDHVGGADLLHAIKSGVVIPLLVGALGLPFTGRRRPDGG